jgi:hypothetical protein
VVTKARFSAVCRFVKCLETAISDVDLKVLVQNAIATGTTKASELHFRLRGAGWTRTSDQTDYESVGL